MGKCSVIGAPCFDASPLSFHLDVEWSIIAISHHGSAAATANLIENLHHTQFSMFFLSETSSLPHVWKAFAIRCWFIFSGRKVSKTLILSVFSTVFVLLAADRACAQTGVSGGIYGPNWGDPYQIVSPVGGNPNSAAVVPAAGGLFGNGRVINGQYSGDLDPYAAPPTAAQLNAPVVEVPAGTPVYSNSGNWIPLLPRFRNRIDSRLYVRGEYLLWDVSGMNAPALVTTSPDTTLQPVAGVLGQSGTSVLFGNTELNDGSTNGLLISGGLWLTPQRSVAIEGEFVQLGQQDDRYNGSSDGTVILGRPFFDVVAGQPSAQLVSYPGLASGGVRVATESEFRSYLIDGRIALCPTHGDCCQACDMQDRTDWIIGYRNLRLRDSLVIDDNLRSELPNVPGTVATSDQFRSTNQFNGLQLGMLHRMLLRRAWLESSVRVAVGNMEQTLRIAGSTVIDELGVVDTYSGGLLAQRTNSGTYSRDEFTMIPELGLRLGMRLTDRLHASIGYSVLYLPNVIRASEQIDTDLNPGLIPEEIDPLTGPLRPRVLWRQTDYLAHGLHFGGELHF